MKGNINQIQDILQDPCMDYNDLIKCCEIVKKNGDVIVIKFDGERLENKHTVFISFPSGKREFIRVDGDDLKFILVKVLSEYVIL